MLLPVENGSTENVFEFFLNVTLRNFAVDPFTIAFTVVIDPA